MELIDLARYEPPENGYEVPAARKVQLVCHYLRLCHDIPRSGGENYVCQEGEYVIVGKIKARTGNTKPIPDVDVFRVLDVVEWFDTAAQDFHADRFVDEDDPDDEGVPIEDQRDWIECMKKNRSVRA
ncbi:MAG TPA: hypothetical protein VEI97_08345 [bacterium]|nr:hypothetical protein [bacterium]